MQLPLKLCTSVSVMSQRCEHVAMSDIYTLCSKRNMGKQSKKPSHKCSNLTDRKRTGKCSFTKAARVDVPFHQTVGGRGAHRMARGYFLEAKEIK